MNYATSQDERAASTKQAAEIKLPAEIDWDMLDKSKFFFLGAALFSGVSFALYPAVVLKTRLQVAPSSLSSLRTAAYILRHEGCHAFYRGFGTSVTGTIPARALYMAALEITKSTVGNTVVRLGLPEPAAATVANAAAGVSAAVAAQVVWTPIDVISQRLMVQGAEKRSASYSGGVDACLKILGKDGLRGLYRGFGVSILTYAPSNAVWWASYATSQRAMWGGIAYYLCRNGGGGGNGSKNMNHNDGLTPGCKMVVAVQGASAAVAGGMAALVTMPFDTVKTRMQVLDGEERGTAGTATSTAARTLCSLVKEGGWRACYRGLGPRWASMSLSAMTMITTYELLKRLSAKSGCGRRSFA